jgi:hypothetical protein
VVLLFVFGQPPTEVSSRNISVVLLLVFGQPPPEMSTRNISWVVKAAGA